MMKRFGDFTMQGSASDLLVSIIIWNFGGDIIYSLVNDIVMPPLGILLGNMDFSNFFLILKEGLNSPGPYATLEAANAAGAVTLNLGRFLNHLVSLTVLGVCICTVLGYFKQLKTFMNKKEDGTKRKCSECDAVVPVHTDRCPHCHASS